jgi:hypothetical protein
LELNVRANRLLKLFGTIFVYEDRPWAFAPIVHYIGLCVHSFQGVKDLGDCESHFGVPDIRSGFSGLFYDDHKVGVRDEIWVETYLFRFLLRDGRRAGWHWGWVFALAMALLRKGMQGGSCETASAGH